MEINIEHRLTAVEDRTKSNSHRLDEVEKRQDKLDDLVGSINVLAVREEQVEKDVKEIKTDVKNLSGKPGKRWDNLVDKIVWAVAAALIAFVLSRLGIS